MLRSRSTIFNHKITRSLMGSRELTVSNLSQTLIEHPCMNVPNNYFLHLLITFMPVVNKCNKSDMALNWPFPSSFYLGFKTSPSAKSFHLITSFTKKLIFMQIKLIHLNGLHLGLVLKQRQETTRKWPNT